MKKQNSGLMSGTRNTIKEAIIMAKRCQWYRDDICDCFCDGLDTNCENYTGDLTTEQEDKKVTFDPFTLKPLVNKILNQ